MVVGKSPEPLPPGWIEHVQVKNGRTIKYYTNGENGKKFYSRKAVINLVNALGDVSSGQNQGINNGDSQIQATGDDAVQIQGINSVDGVDQGTPNQAAGEDGSTRGRRSITSPGSQATPQVGQSADWLPPGWTVELKTKGGARPSNYKCYVSPAGKKFYSKNQVSQYLNSAANGNTPIAQDKTHNVEESSSNLETAQIQTPIASPSRSSRKRKSSVENHTPKTVSAPVAPQSNLGDELPAGWIKELRPRDASGTKKDPFYIDPVSGYEFRSKKDVWRYIQSGDINKCAMKPKKRDPQAASKVVDQNIEVSPSKVQASASPKTMEDSSRTPKRRKSVTSKALSEIVSPASVQNGSVGELPPGWILEYKVRRFAGKLRKDPYYTDPVSGYIFRSKKDAFRFIETGDINKCAMKPGRRDAGSTSNNISSPRAQVSRGRKGTKSRGRSNKKPKSLVVKSPSKAVAKTDSVDGLPPGWIKEIRPRKAGSAVKGDPFYIDPVSGYEFRSKKDALRYLESGDIRRCAMKPTKRGEPVTASKEKSHEVEGSASKLEESQNIAPVEGQSHTPKKRKSQPRKASAEKSLTDGLPPGWIRETRTRMCRGALKEDPYYVDPISGYVFRSRKDALRYVETGDITKCVMKPYKRLPGSSTPKTPNGVSTPNPVTEGETPGQLFAGEEAQVVGNESANATEVGPTEGEGLMQRRRSITQDFLNTDINALTTPASRKRGRPKGSGRNPAAAALNGDAAVDSTNQATTKSRKPRKTGSLSKPEEVPSSGLNDGAFQAEKAALNMGIGEQSLPSTISSSSGIDINTSWGPNDPVQKVVADLGLGEEILHTSVVNTSGIDVNSSAPKPSQHFDANKSSGSAEIYHDALATEPMFQAENRAKQMVGRHDDDVDMNLPLPNTQPQYRSSGDCWSDPCLDFALKTLTGGMAAEAPQDPPYTQGDRCFKLPVFDSSHSGSLDKPGSVPQDSPLLPPGFGVPSYSGINSQQSGLDARKDYPPNL